MKKIPGKKYPDFSTYIVKKVLKNGIIKLNKITKYQRTFSMKNYNTLNEILKDETVNYIKNITNGLGKVDTHFISDVFTGILKYNSIILSDIVRQTGNLNIKKGVERLERHLDSFNKIDDILSANYINLVKPYINNRHLYFPFIFFAVLLIVFFYPLIYTFLSKLFALIIKSEPISSTFSIKIALS